MLAGVLLHVIEAAGQIDPPVHVALPGFDLHEAAAQNMGDAIPFVDHFDDLHSAQLAGVERLAAGRGVERSAIQIDALLVRTRGIRTHVDHASLEFSEIAVLVIEAIRHSTASWIEVLATLSTSSSDIVLLPLWIPDGMVTLT